MKTILATFLLILSIAATSAEFRTWTDAESGRTIKAEILDKKMDSSQIKIRRLGKAAIWLDTSRLSEDDQEFVKNWTPPVDHITARVIGHRKGGIKKVKFNFAAGHQATEIVIKNTVPGRSTVKKKLKPGQVMELTIEVHNDYKATAFHGEQIVDMESYKSKTGL